MKESRSKASDSHKHTIYHSQHTHSFLTLYICIFSNWKSIRFCDLWRIEPPWQETACLCSASVVSRFYKLFHEIKRKSKLWVQLQLSHLTSWIRRYNLYHQSSNSRFIFAFSLSSTLSTLLVWWKQAYSRKHNSNTSCDIGRTNKKRNIDSQFWSNLSSIMRKWLCQTMTGIALYLEWIHSSLTPSWQYLTSKMERSMLRTKTTFLIPKSISLKWYALDHHTRIIHYNFSALQHAKMFQNFDTALNHF